MGNISLVGLALIRRLKPDNQCDKSNRTLHWANRPFKIRQFRDADVDRFFWQQQLERHGIIGICNIASLTGKEHEIMEEM